MMAKFSQFRLDFPLSRILERLAGRGRRAARARVVARFLKASMSCSTLIVMYKLGFGVGETEHGVWSVATHTVRVSIVTVDTECCECTCAAMLAEVGVVVCEHTQANAQRDGHEYNN